MAEALANFRFHSARTRTRARDILGSLVIPTPAPRSWHPFPIEAPSSPSPSPFSWTKLTAACYQTTRTRNITKRRTAHRPSSPRTTAPICVDPRPEQLSESDREPIQKAREELAKAQQEYAEGGLSSDREELEDAQEEYQEEVEEAYN